MEKSNRSTLFASSSSDTNNLLRSLHTRHKRHSPRRYCNARKVGEGNFPSLDSNSVETRANQFSQCLDSVGQNSCSSLHHT